MAKIRNFDELKNFVPNNNNEENYALLTHYLLMENGAEKENKRAELINNFSFEAENLTAAENFFVTKNVPLR